jgi:hypothetical protein
MRGPLLAALGAGVGTFVAMGSATFLVSCVGLAVTKVVVKHRRVSRLEDRGRGACTTAIAPALLLLPDRRVPPPPLRRRSSWGLPARSAREQNFAAAMFA